MLAPTFGLCRRRLLLALIGALLATGAWAASPSLQAVLIDLQGNSHELTQFTFRGGTDFEYYVGGDRRVVPFQQLDRLRFDGDAAAEEQDVLVTLRSGRQERGKFATGVGAGGDQNTDGGGGDAAGFAGNTALGPFFRRAGQVREIVLRHADGQTAMPERTLKASVVTEDGRRFEVQGLLCRGGSRFDYRLGGRDRFADLYKVERIDFEDGHLEDEWRPATVTYWSGRRAVVDVEASIVRLSGETDKAYLDRVNAALTGITPIGPFSVGWRAVKQIRFVAAPAPAPAAAAGAADADSSISPASGAAVVPADSLTK